MGRIIEATIDAGVIGAFCYVIYVGAALITGAA